MEHINRLTMELYHFLLQYVPEQWVPWVFRGTMAFFLLIGFFIFFILLQKEKIVQKSIRNISEQMDMREKLRSKEEEKQEVGAEEDTQDKKSFMRTINRKLEYSGLQNQFPFLTSEVFVLLFIFAVTFAFFLAQLITGSFFFGALAGAIVGIIYIAIEIVMAYKNYVATEKELLNFLNILKNYSLSADEITLIMYKSARHVENPLRNALVECYYESMITGNSNNALIHLTNKLEHPKFKELIRNIEICGRYNGDYNALLANHKESIQNYISSREAQKSANRSDLITFLIIIIGTGFMLYAMGNIIGVNVIGALFTTSMGNIFFGIMAAIIITFVWQVVLFNKD